MFIRLAVMLKRPIHELLEMPPWELKLWLQYLQKLPTAEERLEWCIVQLTTVFVNSNRDPSKSAPRKLSDLFLFADPWEKKTVPDTGDGRYSEVDRSIMAALMGN